MDNASQPGNADADSILQRIGYEAAANIRQDEGVDIALLDILTKRIVVSDPESDAVKQAVEDIKKLAEARAKS